MAHFPTSDGRPPWRALVLTLFPEMFPGPLDISLLGQARTANIWSLETLQIRDFGLGRHRQVDDTPAGGGAGMVLRADVLGPALDHAQTLSPDAPLIYLSPRGTPLTQSLARDLSEGPGVTLLAGRFEGIDQRVIDEKSLKEVSIGDYVLAGGELAAMVLIEACVRLLPGVLGAAESLASESFETGLLEYPQYTKPRDWEGRSIPEILLSGDHKKVAEWRRRQSEQLTAGRRPDLLRPTRTPK
ncbi:tRNA (guanosine(37)-N1)-methyltransferase TrmD [Hyphomicrobium sp.]|uniref:tRNA (guanosine(37)-N1)-methyltransferase TrmD n=1 Tax=Hyphomicrobium sp. TaxID=82 RepID=UPI000F96C711|nr:tRNA (guanosine(37)-N1)-methyltransferase TrmD [Hyphomicrobium sp.]RUP09003.1 MAG: tRNA (guanosine(37)-N1)-methyltransferase TrmD [Hyphomicrobium sp.]